jgi:hypothetical protein
VRGRKPNRQAWEKALEGWNVKDSQIILEWIALGEARGKAKAMARGVVEGWASTVLQILTKRFAPGPPAEVTTTIRGATDRAQVQRWLDLALDADSLDAFRRGAGL